MSDKFFKKVLFGCFFEALDLPQNWTRTLFTHLRSSKYIVLYRGTEVVIQCIVDDNRLDRNINITMGFRLKCVLWGLLVTQ